VFLSGAEGRRRRACLAHSHELHWTGGASQHRTDAKRESFIVTIRINRLVVNPASRIERSETGRSSRAFSAQPRQRQIVIRALDVAYI